jgi:hypothetical protein
MSDKRQIKEAIERLSGTFMQDSVKLFLASVDSVNEAERTCDVTPLTDNATTSYPSVLLMAESDDGVLIVPTIGSNVIVNVSKRGVAYVCMFSEVDKITIITKTLTQFNDGSFGGLVKVQELVDKINRLENTFNTHVHAGVTSGGSSTAPPSSTIAPITMKTDIENDKITHGI